jgi:hypothetical protein
MLYTFETLELWRPIIDPNEPTRTIASQFRISSAGTDAFRRSIPLASPKLETNEEFVVVKGKLRPVMLIQPEAADMAIDNRGYRGKVQRKKSLVAQVFGLVDTKTGLSGRAGTRHAGLSGNTPIAVTSSKSLCGNCDFTIYKFLLQVLA